MTEGWVIQVSMNFTYFGDLNADDISFSALYDV